MDTDELTRLVKADDVQGLVDGLAGLNETQRKKLAPTAKQLAHWKHRDRYPQWPVVLAVLGCVSAEVQVARILGDIWNLQVPDDRAAKVLKDRSPHWLDKLPGALTRLEARPWALVRSLVRVGVVAPPGEPDYYVHMVWGSLSPGGLLSSGTAGALDGLIADPTLLEHEVWQMLATERAGRQLTTTDGFLGCPRTYGRGPDPEPTPHRTWNHALVTLAAEGRLDRDRLLDAALSAPLRDWAPVDVTWFVGLHNALAPTDDEVRARQSTYIRLLAVEHGPAVKLAQKALTPLLGDADLDTAALLGASEATVTRSDKASVIAQLTLLKALVKHRPDLGDAVGGVVAAALEHPRPDVRERAEGMLATLGHSVAAAPLRAGFVAPLPEARPDPDPVRPVEDVDELTGLILDLLEEADAPIEVERALEGLVRLHDKSPRSRAEVLLKRAAQRNREFSSLDLRCDLATLATSWLTEKPSFWKKLKTPEPWSIPYATAPHEGSLVWFHHLRMGELSRAVKAKRGVSVALPTHTDGTITGEALGERLAALGKREPLGAVDVAVALLRVPPAELSEDLVPRHLREPWIRHTIGALREWSPQWERVRGTSNGMYHFSRDQAVVTYRTTLGIPIDGGAVTRLLDRREAVRSAGWDGEIGQYQVRFEQLLALWATYFPHHPEAFCSHVHPQLFGDLQRARGTSAPVLDFVALSPSPPGPVGASALVLGLAAKDVLVRTAAQDALLDLARHGLLDGAQFGRQAVDHLADDTVVGSRVSGGLRALVQVDDATVLPVLDALEVLLSHTEGRRDAAAFVELAADLVERSGRRIAVPAHLADLAAGRSTSLAAKAARRL